MLPFTKLVLEEHLQKGTHVWYAEQGDYFVREDNIILSDDYWTLRVKRARMDDTYTTYLSVFEHSTHIDDPDILVSYAKTCISSDNDDDDEFKQLIKECIYHPYFLTKRLTRSDTQRTKRIRIMHDNLQVVL